MQYPKELIEEMNKLPDPDSLYQPVETKRLYQLKTWVGLIINSVLQASEQSLELIIIDRPPQNISEDIYEWLVTGKYKVEVKGSQTWLITWPKKDK